MVGRPRPSAEYSRNGVNYRREVFANYPQNSYIVVRLTASKPGALNFTGTFKGAHDGSEVSVRRGLLYLNGGVKDSAIRFEAQLHVAIEGGQREEHGASIVVTGANSATLTRSSPTSSAI